MSEFGQPITLIELLDQHGLVRIPYIQRDYAQGRADESVSEIRAEFLGALLNGVMAPVDDPSVPLNLDFIYGTVEGPAQTKFVPLDGQQRLTTLFLLHWYLAWRDSRFEQFQESFCLNGRSRFAYSVRPSSTEFYDQLVNFMPDSDPEAVESISELVTNQPWYFRYWRLDPTIQSTLTMLQAIHGLFGRYSGLYDRLANLANPAITFQLLPLKDFGLSDDLYIKMNARGKPLTEFETFKARYEHELKLQFGTQVVRLSGKSISIPEFFSRQMDTTWAEFFWAHRDTTTNLYDDAVMNFFRATIMATRNPESDSFWMDDRYLRSKSVKSSFSVFHARGWLDQRFSEALILLLEAWSADGVGITCQLPTTKHFNEGEFLSKIVSEPTELSFTEIVQFAGYIMFLREHQEDQSDSLQFDEWMRIVHNLSVNTRYNRSADIQRSLAGLLKLVALSGSVLEHFASAAKPVAGFSEQQIAEERLKAQLILAHEAWRPLIDRAEAHEYFRGQIEFLLDFCGVTSKLAEPKTMDWNDGEHISLQESFEEYLAKAELMFAKGGLTDYGDYRWERALLCIGDYTLNSGANRSFLVNSITGTESWKWLLRGFFPRQRAIIKELFDRLVLNESIADQLDEIINTATQLDRWREALVHTPEALKYCEAREFRRGVGDQVYLLKKTQMNGYHAELFTYSLYQTQLLPLHRTGGFAPLTLCEYYSAKGVDLEPGIRFKWSRNDDEFFLELEWHSFGFFIYVPTNALANLPDVKDVLCKQANFAANERRISRVAEDSDILGTLNEIRSALANLPSDG